MSFVKVIPFWLSLLFSSLLPAHEGHVHEEPKAIVTPDQIVVHETTTEVIELVLKHPMFEPGKPTLSRVFLSTADENKPVKSANIEFEFAELDDLKINFAPVKDLPGVYSANVRLPKSGVFEATVSISGSNVNDLLTLTGIEVKPVLTQKTASQIPYIYLLAALSLLLFIALIVVIMIRRRKHD